MKKLLIGLLLFVQGNFAYAVTTYKSYSTLIGDSASCSSLSDTMYSCAVGVSQVAYTTPSLLSGFLWQNPNTGVLYTIQLQSNNTVALIEGSTTVGTYSGNVIFGFGMPASYLSTSQIVFQTPDKITVSLHFYKSTLDTWALACVTYPGMSGYPNTYYCHKNSMHYGTSAYYSNFP